MAGAKENLLTTLKANLARMGAAGDHFSRAAVEQEIDRTAAEEADANAAADEPQGDAEDRQRATLTEWRNLSAATGKTVQSLQLRADLEPRKTTLEVHRTAPFSFEGKAILLGQLPGFTYQFPFNLGEIRRQVNGIMGGGKFALKVYDHNSREIGASFAEFADEPRNPPKVRNAEEEAPTALPEEPRGEPLGGPGGEQDGLMRMTPNQLDEVIAQRIQAAREEMGRDFDLRTELAELRRSIVNVAAKPSGGDNGGLQLLAQTMMEGLKLALTGMGDKLAGVQESQTKSLEMMMKLNDARAQSQAEITKIQMEAKKSETDLLMKVFGDQRDKEELKADRVLEILQMGMGFAERLQRPPESENKEGWLEEGLKGLINVFANRAVEAQKIPQVQLPLGSGPEPPSQTPEEIAAQRKFIEETAARAAARIAQKVKAREAALKAKLATQRKAAPVQPAPVPPPTGGLAAPAQPVPAASPPPPVAAPAPPPAEEEITELTEQELDEAMGEAESAQAPEVPPLPADPEQAKRVVLNTALKLVVQEMGTKPPLSSAVRYLLKTAPPDWCAKFISTENAGELADYFKPYADPALVKEIKDRATADAKATGWLTNQAGLLQAYLKQMVAGAQPPAAAKEGQP